MANEICSATRRSSLRDFALSSKNQFYHKVVPLGPIQKKTAAEGLRREAKIRQLVDGLMVAGVKTWGKNPVGMAIHFKREAVSLNFKVSHNRVFLKCTQTFGEFEALVEVCTRQKFVIN